MANVEKNECLINGVQYKCRTCFDPGRTIHQLTDEASNNRTWLDLLKDVAHLQPNDDAQLPKTLCCKCSEKLKRSYDFVVQIQNVNEKYSELLTKNNVLNQTDNIADCLAESVIALPLEQYMPEVKLEEEMVMTYDINMTNKLEDDSEERFDNEDNDDPFDEENATEPLHDNERATEENTAERNRYIRKGRRQNLLKKRVKNHRVSSNTRKANADNAWNTNKAEKLIKDGKSYDLRDAEASSVCAIFSQTFFNVHENKKNDAQITNKLQKAIKAEQIDDIDVKGSIACAKCPQSFFTLHEHQRHQYKKHTSKELSEDLLKCPICGMKLSQKSVLIKHIRIVHDKIKPYKCSQCTKAFGSATAKNHHELSHSDFFAYPCDHCNSRFRVLSKLKQHLEVHTTKPELLCPICKRGQKSQEELKAHIKNHEDNRLQCPSCGKLFGKRQNLDGHYNAVHLKLKPFKCDYCDQYFADSKTKRRHERRRHKKTGSVS